jgi:hypothetical protein
MFFESIRDAVWAFRQVDGLLALRLGILDALLDVANRIQILAQLGTIAGFFVQKVNFSAICTTLA